MPHLHRLCKGFKKIRMILKRAALLSKTAFHRTQGSQCCRYPQQKARFHRREPGIVLTPLLAMQWWGPNLSLADFSDLHTGVYEILSEVPACN